MELPKRHRIYGYTNSVIQLLTNDQQQWLSLTRQADEERESFPSSNDLMYVSSTRCVSDQRCLPPSYLDQRLALCQMILNPEISFP